MYELLPDPRLFWLLFGAHRYMSEFGFYEQPVAATITVGTFQCKLLSHSDTLIRCHVVYGDMYEPLKVRVAVHGKGNAKCAESFTFALDIYDVTPNFGSLAGGTELTVKTSALPTNESLGVSR